MAPLYHSMLLINPFVFVCYILCVFCFVCALRCDPVFLFSNGIIINQVLRIIQIAVKSDVKTGCI